MKNWLRKIWIIFREKIFRSKVRRTRELTIKGQYFRKYCGDVIEGTESRIADYEEMLETIRGCLKTTDGDEVTREEAARYFLEVTTGMDEEQ